MLCMGGILTSVEKTEFSVLQHVSVCCVLQIRHSLLTQALYRKCNKYLKGENDLISCWSSTKWEIKVKWISLLEPIKKILSLFLGTLLGRVENIN